MPSNPNLPYVGRKGNVVRTVADHHAESGCREGKNCTGPGCNVKRDKR